MRITMIGSGNVATHMAAALKNAGHKIMQVYSRIYQNAALLAYHVKAEAIDQLADISAETDLFIIALKDDAITDVAEFLSRHNKLTIHTSGATALSCLSQFNHLSGVFYPLQTFSKRKEIDFWQVPLCIEGLTNEITDQLEALAQTISNQVFKVSSDQRKVVHLAAVFACNFPNFLYGIAERLLSKNDLSFDLLKPLIMETASKVQNDLPQNVQTGPAIRNDTKTMNLHKEMLEPEKELINLYDLLSQSIIKMAVAQQPDK